MLAVSRQQTRREGAATLAEGLKGTHDAMLE